jgi:hypothetical protein
MGPQLLSFINSWNLGPGRVSTPFKEVGLKETTIKPEIGDIYRHGVYSSLKCR